jgi:FkbM family methyltransferase
MDIYKRNKIKTAVDIFRQIENWPTAFAMRLQRERRGLRLLSFRNGLNVVCRSGTNDWGVIHELYFKGIYNRAMAFLKDIPGRPVILDLGANIGLFSLMAAATHAKAEIHAYEPGPPNYRLFEINCLANPALEKRIHLNKEAIGGKTTRAEWIFSDQNPAGSGFYTKDGERYQVQIRAFADVINALPGEIALAKIDIEGTEYDLLANTSAETWRRIQAISLEVHGDPSKKCSPGEFLRKMSGFGFKIEEENVVNYFLHR